MDEFAVNYSIDKLAKRLDELDTIRRKLDPQNFNPTDTHMSIEEKYRARTVLDDTITYIKVLEAAINSNSRRETAIKFFKPRK